MTTYQYQGKGASIAGVPARNLTEKDVARLTDEQKQALTETKYDGKQLYTKRSEPKAAERADGKSEKD